MTGEIAVLTHILDVMIKDVEPAVLHEWAANIEGEIIRQRGLRDGRNAGTWVFDGTTTQDQIDKVQQGIKDGDPDIVDQLPEPRVGGEFAGEPTWEDILTDEGIPVDSTMDPTGRGDLYQIYFESFRDGVEFEVLSYGEESRAS